MDGYSCLMMLQMSSRRFYLQRHVAAVDAVCGLSLFY